MTERSIWKEMNSAPDWGGLVVVYDAGIGLVDDGDHVWIADAERLRDTIQWAGRTLLDDHNAHEAYAIFWGRCPGWIVEDIRKGDGFPLDIHDCIQALENCGYSELVPAFWDRDEEAF